MKSQTKALLASVMVLALALSSIGGVTYSWFSDSGSVNIGMSTADINVEVSIEGDGNSVSDTGNGTFGITGLTTNEIRVLQVIIKNKSSIPVTITDLHPEVIREFYYASGHTTIKINPGNDLDYNKIYESFYKNGDHVLIGIDNNIPSQRVIEDTEHWENYTSGGVTYTRLVEVYSFPSTGPLTILNGGEISVPLKIEATDQLPSSINFPLRVCYTAVQSNYNELTTTIPASSAGMTYSASISPDVMNRFNVINISGIPVNDSSVSLTIQGGLFSEIREQRITDNISVIIKDTPSGGSSFSISIERNGTPLSNIHGIIQISIAKNGGFSDVHSLIGGTSEEYRPSCMVEPIEGKTRIVFNNPINYSEVYFS